MIRKKEDELKEKQLLLKKMEDSKNRDKNKKGDLKKEINSLNAEIVYY